MLEKLHEIKKKWIIATTVILLFLGSITIILTPDEFSIVLKDETIKAKYSEGILKAYSGRNVAFEDYLNIYYWNGKGYITMYKARGDKYSPLSYYNESGTTFVKQTIYYSQGNLTRYFEITEYKIKESFEWNPKDENLRTYFLWTYGKLDKFSRKHVYLDKNIRGTKALMDFDITNDWEKEIDNIVRVERFQNGKLKIRTKIFEGNAIFDPEIILEENEIVKIKDKYYKIKDNIKYKGKNITGEDFYKLVSIETSLSYGIQVYKATNIFDKKMSINHFTGRILKKDKSKETKKMDITVLLNESYSSPVYKNELITKTCNKTDNKTKEIIYFNCSYNISVFDYNETKYIWNEYNITNQKIQPNETVRIKVYATWDIKLGENSRDYRPQIIIPKEYVEDKDIILEAVNMTWWNNSYPHKKPIEVNVSSNVSDYQMELVVLYDSDMNSSFSDIRFTNADETEELYYWIHENKTYDGVNTTIFVKGNYTTDNGTQIYMYYGNSGIATTSDGDNTFMFFDNFETSIDWTNKWQSASQASYTIENGQLKMNRITNVANELFSKNSYSNFIWETIGYCSFSAAGQLYVYFEPDASFSAKDGSAIRGGNTVTIEIDNNAINPSTSATHYYVFELEIPTSDDASAILKYSNRTTIGTKTGTPTERTGYVSFMRWNEDGYNYMNYIFLRKHISIIPTYSFGAEQNSSDITPPHIEIQFPTVTTYSENVSNLNYTVTEVYPDSCWYSIDSGVTNSSVESSGTNFTNITSVGGSNTWTVYCNDTSGNVGSDSVTFNLNNLWYNSGYPYSDKDFRTTKFITVDGNDFMLGSQQYRFLGTDSYYLADYATNHTYDDDGNEINNSRQAILEILNEAQYLNINVIRTWASSQGGEGSHWEVNKSGGHWNLFEVNEPGNYSEKMFASLDWVIYEASKRNIRLQLVLVNNWNDYGGMRWYVQMSPTTNKTHENVSVDVDPTYYWSEFHDQFYDDENCRQYYRNYVNYTLNRNNTYSGLLYKDDPAIFSWLLANEPRAKSNGTGRGLIEEWTTNMTAYIKSIDSNHLVGLGIEGWGYVETWGEGTDMIADHNNTGVDFATFALHPDQWKYFAERSEHTGGGDNWVTDGINTNEYVDWWTNDTNVTFNNRYASSNDPADYIPEYARGHYDNWVTQNVKLANELGMPVLLQEAGYKTTHTKELKDRFYEQMIHNFYNEGGDGLMFWTLNHDDYYYSTNVNGTMDDSYGFYVSDDAFLKNKSQSVLDAADFTLTDNGGGSWVNQMNSYKYDFIINIGFASDTVIDNCTLFLNVSNGTEWTDYYADQSNTSAIINDESYLFEKQFNDTDEEVYWYTECYDDSTTITSDVEHIQIQTGIPVVTLYAPKSSGFSNNNTVEFIYDVTEVADLGMSNCELFIDDVLNKTDYTITTSVNQSFSSILLDGTYDWYVMCTDIDDNSDVSETRNFIVDATEPYVEIYSPLNTTYNTTNITLNYTSSDTNLNTTWYEYNLTNTTLTGNITFTALDNQQSTLVLWSNDTAGNTNSTSVTFTVDTTPPTYALNSTNSTFAGISIEHRLKWEDNMVLSGYIFSFDNGTGTFSNDSWVSMTGTLNWSNITKSVNSTIRTNIAWKVYANDTANNWNVSDTYSYITTLDDTCSNCDGTGDCYWDFSDNCNITDNRDNNGYNLIINQSTPGNHTITITGNLKNFGNITRSGYNSSNLGYIISKNGGGFR